jgi:predicted transcriptional regulator
MVARVTVTLPDALLARLDAIAGDESVTRSDVVREAAAGYVTSYESGLVAREREASVASGLSWLEEIAHREPADPRPTLEILRELRAEPETMGRPIEPHLGGSNR